MAEEAAGEEGGDPWEFDEEEDEVCHTNQKVSYSGWGIRKRGRGVGLVAITGSGAQHVCPTLNSRAVAFAWNRRAKSQRENTASAREG